MDWLAWSDVARLLAAVAGVLAAAVAGLWTLGRMFRPWMRDAAREAAESLYVQLKENDFKLVEDRIDEGLRDVREAAESLYVQLKENDFKLVEDRIDEGLRDVSDRLERVEGRAQADRAALRKDFGDQLGRMEARILEAVRERGAAPPEDSPPPG